MANMQLSSAVNIAGAGDLLLQIQAALAESDNNTLTVDASQVERFDFSMYQLLVSAKKTIASEGGHFGIDSPSDCFLRGAEVLGVKSLLLD